MRRLIRSLTRLSVAASGLFMAASLVLFPMSAGAGTPPDTLDATAAQAQKLFVRGLTQAYLDNYERAIGLFERALELAPNEAPILSAMADAQAEQEATETAIFYAEQARTIAPENAHYYRQLASLHQQQGDTESAIAVYRTLSSRFPDDMDARLELADMLSESNQAGKAVVLYEEVEQQMGQATPQMYMQMLQLYRRINDSENVVRVLRALVQLRPEERLFRQLLGQYYLKEGQIDNAIRLHETTLEANPNDVETAMGLAELYREQGRTEDADRLLRKLSDTEGASADQLVRRAQALHRRSRTDREAAQQAIQFLERALKLEPNHEGALHLLGDLRYQNEQYGEAAALFKRAIDQNPRVMQRWIQASASYLQADQLEQAVEVAEEGLLLFPGQVPLLQIAAKGLFALNRNQAAIERFEALRALQRAAPEDTPADRRADVLASLGLLYNRVGNMDASDRAYQEAIAIDDQHAMALNNYAYSLADRGLRLDEAEEMAQRAVELDSNNASYLDTLGWVFFQQEQFEQAAKWLQQAIDTGEASATVYEHYGDVQEALGNSSAARTYWQQALDRAPNRDALRQKLNALGN
jgi:tetratricopeptide (TPR) repeat protein